MCRVALEEKHFGRIFYVGLWMFISRLQYEADCEINSGVFASRDLGGIITRREVIVRTMRGRVQRGAQTEHGAGD